MSERDNAPAVETSLWSAVTLLDERGPAAARMAVEEVLSALPGRRGGTGRPRKRPGSGPW